MHLQNMKTLLTILLPLTTVTVSADFLPRSLYHRDIAPSHLTRVASYRSQADTPSKRAVLDQLDSLIETRDVSAVPKVRKACDAAFGSAFTHLLTGKSADGGVDGVVKRGSSPLLRRDPICQCTDANEYCESGYSCEYGALGCDFTSKGCGTLGMYVCNGLCMKDQWGGGDLFCLGLLSTM
jgi:hypothetical protein